VLLRQIALDEGLFTPVAQHRDCFQPYARFRRIRVIRHGVTE
jgi:hypothetical protein